MLVTENTDFHQIQLKKSASFMGVIKATIIKDLVMKKRYRVDFIGELIRAALFIGVFALFANAYTLQGMDTFDQVLLFFISGFLLVMYDGVTLWTPLNTVTNDLYNGTLEYLYSSPNSRFAYFIGNICAAALYESILVVPVLFFISIYFSLPLQVILMILLILVVVISVLIAFGTMFALLGVMFRQTSSIAGILSAVFQFLGGFLIPISQFPRYVQYISMMLPYTWGIDLLRAYTIDGWVTILPIPMMWVILLIQGIILWTIATRLIVSVEKYGKKSGLHLI